MADPNGDEDASGLSVANQRRKRKRGVHKLKGGKLRKVKDGNTHVSKIITAEGRKRLSYKYLDSSIFSHITKGRVGVKTILKTRALYNPLSWVRKYGINEGGLGSAIFNLEFSADNRFLVAACENKDILLFDPCIHKMIKSVPNAHNDSVNGVMFLDSRTFATCSDDNTIALWDVRNLESKVRSLTGHTSWVKSMSYDSYSNSLISSGFDNTVRVWNVNEYTDDNSVKSNKVMHVPFLTRTVLSHDFKKFMVATTTGLLFVIHDIDFSTVEYNITDHLKNGYNCKTECKPSDIGDQLSRNSKKANRIEYLRTFPFKRKPWCIASLQIHPNNWNVLSRYTCRDNSEWSVVHNIAEPSENIGMKKCLSRLQSYIEEPSVAGGYIKEISYNHDGTVICSPFGNGIRLFGFNSKCDQFPKYILDEPKKLKEIRFITKHNAPVLTTRFAKYFPIVASGCLGGEISFYQPKF